LGLDGKADAHEDAGVRNNAPSSRVKSVPNLSRDEVMVGTATEVRWWLKNRLAKFSELSHETMAINPFMAPVLMALHSHSNMDELAELLLGGHFMTGHSTGFGKLIDEKILPNVFKTTKLNKAFRFEHPYNSSLFDEIDHLVYNDDQVDYLSLKSSRWTIQLTMATGLNATFHKLIEKREEGEIEFGRIVVGVIYGQEADMTDKYRIIRGINTGANHSVFDIQQHVEVVTGRNLWTWLNGGESDTQEWIVDGILKAIRDARPDLLQAKKHLQAYKDNFASSFNKYISDDGIDWHAIVREVNG
jgi:hypothetical protein